MPDVNRLIVDNVVFSEIANSGKTSESVCANIRYLAKCILDADEKAVFGLEYGGGTARNVALYLRRAFENAEGIQPKP